MKLAIAGVVLINSTIVPGGGKCQYCPVLAFGHSKLCEQEIAAEPLVRNLKVIHSSESFID